MIPVDVQVSATQAAREFVESENTPTPRFRRGHGRFGTKAVAVSSGSKRRRRLRGHDVPARRQVCEVVSLLAEQRTNEPQAVMAARLEHAPCRKVADALRSTVDGSLRVKGKVCAYDAFALLRKKP